MAHARFLLIGVVAGAACEKVPIVDVNARFALADATWFEEEETLFVFYRVVADQGLGPESQIEVAWRTDDVEQPWTPLSALGTVHSHVPVECGSTSRCGSTSVHVPRLPRDVRLRLRYHRDGEMTLDAPVVFNAIAAGPPHTHRSLVVYGVFDQSNTRVQWRARHQFPTLRNQEVEALGLRRHFEISEPRHGALDATIEANPYGYGFAPTCPQALTPLARPPVDTDARAVFDPAPLPIETSSSPVVCARSTVTDAKGTFEAVALARKNPEVAAAFPLLRSPIRTSTPLGFLLRPCARTISDAHLAMQVQRLQLEGAPEVCIDDWASPGFADQLAARFRARVDQVRIEGRDMVLVLALHHDDLTGQLAGVVEQALQQTLPAEGDKSSPRVVGAFVFDSFAHALALPDLKRLALWCPANLPGDDLDKIPAASARACPLMPDLPDLELGPFRFGNLPILPTRAQYLTFLEKYSEAQAGRMRSLSFRAPERTPISEDVPVGDFGVATFFNNEVLTAAASDVFSYCPPEEGATATVFRVPGVPEPMPLAMLPDVHLAIAQPAYPLGLLWDFPFLLRLEYEVAIAGTVSAYSLTVPFGVSSPQETYYGAPLWEKGDFPLSDRLLRCTRFCDHPTFDSAGVYNLGSIFQETYRAACYRPRYPVPDDGGFPLDP